MVSECPTTYFYRYLNNNEETFSECSICLEDISEDRAEHPEGGERHPFHVNCIKQSLTYKKECPVCRKNVVELSMEPLKIDPKQFSIFLVAGTIGIIFADFVFSHYKEINNFITIIPQPPILILGTLNGVLCSELSNNKVAFVIASIFSCFMCWNYLSSN